MRALTFISFAVFSSLSVLAILFKIMHWPGANIGLVIGFTGIALITIPSFARYKYRLTNT